MDPITIGLIVGFGGSILGNILQARQVSKLQEQIRILKEINAQLLQELENCRRELEALRIWHIRKKREAKQQINALREMVDYIRYLVESEDQEKIEELLDGFAEAA